MSAKLESRNFQAIGMKAKAKGGKRSKDIENFRSALATTNETNSDR